MKIICAGLSKTGTKSMNAALTTLGYKVYDYLENFEILDEQWNQIFQTDGDVTGQLRKMYKNIDATCDAPVYGYWEDMLKAFPDAKVILMVRSDPDTWLESFLRQIRSMEESFLPVITNIFSPTMRKLVNFNFSSGRPTFGYIEKKLLGNSPPPPDILLKIAYKKHNAYVQQVCPAYKLLIFNCKDGWEPLCKFLQLPTPNTPFPHKNIKGSVTEELLLPSKTFQNVKREVAVRMGTMFTLVSLGVWKLLQLGMTPSSCWKSLLNMF